MTTTSVLVAKQLETAPPAGLVHLTGDLLAKARKFASSHAASHIDAVNSSEQTGGWKKVSARPELDLQIFKRSTPNAALTQFKAVGVFEGVTPQELVRFISDTQNRPNWDEDVSSFTVKDLVLAAAQAGQASVTKKKSDDAESAGSGQTVASTEEDSNPRKDFSPPSRTKAEDDDLLPTDTLSIANITSNQIGPVSAREFLDISLTRSLEPGPGQEFPTWFVATKSATDAELQAMGLQTVYPAKKDHVRAFTLPGSGVHIRAERGPDGKIRTILTNVLQTKLGGWLGASASVWNTVTPGVMVKLFRAIRKEFKLQDVKK